MVRPVSTVGAASQHVLDCITQAAADSEVLLPIATGSDQASTAAPADDDQSVFGREEAVRLDEEIMDFQWFNTVTWDSMEDLRGTTYVQSPPRFKFALQQAQHAILHATRSLLSSIGTSMEGSRAQQLAPPGASRCQSLGEQLRALLGGQT